jgi:hypothetical protein
MKKILNSGLALILLAITSVTASAQLLYITDTSGNYGTVNLATNAVTVLGKSGVVLHDIAFTSNGNLYGNTATSLYSMNVNNGATTLIGNFNAGGGQMVGLTGYGSQLIAASSATKSLYVVNTSPMKTTGLTGTLTAVTNGDITFGANGALYDIVAGGVLDKITISGNSFTTVAIGNTGNSSISGMATEPNGTVIAVAGTSIYSVNLTTAALTLIDNYAGKGLGTVTGAAMLASSVVVPEPSNIALLLAGAVGLVLYQKRRSAKLV